MPVTSASAAARKLACKRQLEVKSKLAAIKKLAANKKLACKRKKADKKKLEDQRKLAAKQDASKVATSKKSKLKMRLTNLNEDVLFNIFEYLELPELCAMSQTCSRFSQIARRIADIRYRVLPYVELLTAHNGFQKGRCNVGFKTAMTFMGPSVQQICINRILPSQPFIYMRKFVPLLRNHFPKLNQIVIKRMDDKYSNRQRVKDFESMRIIDDSKIYEHIVTMIHKYWPIDGLCIKRSICKKGVKSSQEFRGHSFILLRNVSAFEDDQKGLFCGANIMNLLENNNITHLDISECKSDYPLDLLLEKLVHRASLNFLQADGCNVDFTSVKFNNICFFPGLRDVYLRGNKLNSNVLQRFGGCPQLKNIYFDYTPDLEQGVLELVRKSPLLEGVFATMCDSDTFSESLIEGIIAARRFRKDGLKLNIVYNTMVDGENKCMLIRNQDNISITRQYLNPDLESIE